jgi:hypothetical protein
VTDQDQAMLTPEATKQISEELCRWAIQILQDHGMPAPTVERVAETAKYRSGREQTNEE